MKNNCQCKILPAVQQAQWEQIKTLSALVERIEKEGDRLQELYQQAEHEREQMRAAFIEQYLRKRLEVEPKDKKGATGDNRITFNKVERNVS
jgi:5'-deoxynucleotidase YfbR-like HD superfamily hydrolase